METIFSEYGIAVVIGGAILWILGKLGQLAWQRISQVADNSAKIEKLEKWVKHHVKHHNSHDTDFDGENGNGYLD